MHHRTRLICYALTCVAPACEGRVHVQVPGGSDATATGSGVTHGESSGTTDAGDGGASGSSGSASDDSTHPPPTVRFVDVTDEAGIGYTLPALHTAPDCLLDAGNESTGLKPGALCDPEYMTGGAAVGDYDQDGWPDLYATRTRAGDIDNDGDLDLYVTTIGDPRYSLFVNEGDGTFVEDAVARGAALDTGAPHAGFGATFGDYDLDGYIDLHLTEWRPLHESGPMGSHNMLLRNVGASAPGTFENVTVAAGVRLDLLDHRGIWAFGSTFVDLDQDTWPDLAVTADFGMSRLFWNDGDGTFSDGTDAAMVGTDENGMGSAFGDFDGDGLLDWLVTAVFDPLETCELQQCNWGSTGNRLFANLGGRKLFDRTDAAGVRDGGWGWGTSFIDWDNDGDLDIVQTNGWTYNDVTLTVPFQEEPMRAWENQGDGTMVEVSQALGLTDSGQGRGLLVFDYDRDGDVDVFVVNNFDGPRLFRNDGGNDRDHVRVELRGDPSNADGLGAIVVVATDGGQQTREIGVGSHFLGQSERTAHFGVGAGVDPIRSVTVRWPSSGIEQSFDDVERNTTLLVEEGVGG